METSKASKEGSGASASASVSVDDTKSQKQKSKRSIYDDSDSLLTVDPSQYKKFGRVSGPTASRSSSSSSGPLFKPTWTDADGPNNSAMSSSLSTTAGKDKEGKTSRSKEKDNAMMKRRVVTTRSFDDNSNNGSIIVMIVLFVIGMPLFVEDVLSRGLEQTNVSCLCLLLLLILLLALCILLKRILYLL